jgi:nucleotide-binding universal stress UspA family protein
MTEPRSPLGQLQDILLATDASEGSRSAEAAAMDMAERCGARLHILRVVITTPGETARLRGWVTETRDAALGYVNALREQAGSRGLAADTHVCMSSDPYAEIAATARGLGCTLSVIGHHERSEFARLVKGHSVNRLIEKAHASVLVVPAGAAMPSARILAATDGSPFGDAAVRAAVDLAGRCALPLTVVSVLRPEADAARRAEVQAAVDRAREAAGEAVAFEGRCLEGKPAEAILAAARESGADLIVLGSMGRGGIGRLLLGSVAERVVSRPPCAVMVITSA